jgi:hypothetical protein
MLKVLARIAFALGCVLLLPTPCNAQLFRAYVSVAGNDANPCTVAAPCRLLPAAIAAVASGGEIWILDSANYNAGTVDIDKSVSIMAVPGQIASVVAVSGNPAIRIATAGVKVGMRNLVIGNNATSPGGVGIDMTNGSSLTVEDSLLVNLPGGGINVVGTSATINVRNTVFRNMPTQALVVQNGPTANVVSSQLLNTGGTMVYSSVAGNTLANITDSEISNGGTIGVYAVANVPGAVVKVSVTRSTIHNSGYGIDCETAPSPGQGAALVTLSYSTITGNRSAGVYSNGTPAVVKTFGNNHIADNFTDVIGTLTSAALR